MWGFDRGAPYRLDGLLFLRGIAAFTVVIHHLQFGPFLAGLTGIPLLHGLAVTGSYSVFVFFCLSGYLMVKVLDRHYHPTGYRSFYLNRAVRIFPVYYLAVGVTLLLTGAPVDPPQLLPVIGFWFNYDLNAFPNAALWTISTEVQFYLLCPLIFLLERRWRHAPALLFLLGLAAKTAYFFLYQADVAAHREIYTGLETNLVYFMAGWMAYRYRARLPRLPGAVALGTALLTLVGLWAAHALLLENTTAGLYGSPLWIFVFPLLLCAVVPALLPSLDRTATAAAAGGAGRWWRPGGLHLLSFLGVASYSAYVLHLPILAALEMSPPGELLSIYAAAAAVYVILEMPTFRLRRRFARPVAGQVND